MDYRKLVDIGIRCIGLYLLYVFFSDLLTVVNMLIGYDELRSHALEEAILFGILDLMTGIYFLFFPKNIVSKIVMGRDSEYLNLQDIRSHQLLLEIGIKLFGVYLFYVFMYNVVTSLNVALDNYKPGDVEAVSFVVQAAFNLLGSILLILKTETISEMVYGKKSI